MRKYYFIFLLLLLTLFTGCNNKNVVKHDYTFHGESEHWSAEYVVDGKGTFSEKGGKTHYDSEVSTNFTLTYNGTLDEISSMKNLKYHYESSSSAGGQELNFDKPLTDKDKVFTNKSSGKGTAIESPNEVIQVTVQWDGNTEKLELKNIAKSK